MALSWWSFPFAALISLANEGFQREHADNPGALFRGDAKRLGIGRVKFHPALHFGLHFSIRMAYLVCSACGVFKEGIGPAWL
jgi:hypothetical protein